MTIPIAAGGAGGNSFSGFSFGGDGAGRGPGGNGYTGATASTRGGDVYNIADDNAAGGAGGGDTLTNGAAGED